MNKRNPKHIVSWQRISLWVLCSALSLVLFALILVTVYVNNILGHITYDENSHIHGTLSSEQLATATDPEYSDPDNTSGTGTTDKEIVLETVPESYADSVRRDGVFNILLVGEDRRPDEGRQRSDSMILCSFDTNNGTITMVSFLRDTYSVIPGYKSNKLNLPYLLGGVELLDRTLAVNYGVPVDANIVVNFEGFKSIIDMLGGVSINLTEAEAEHMNKIYGWHMEPGLQHLNGSEALAYSRIRKIDWDIKRTERQRNVLTAILNSFRSKDLFSMLTIAGDILQSGYIDTDMSSDELMYYIKQVFPLLSSATIKNQHIPALNTFEEMNIGNVVDCKVPDLEANREILKNILGWD